MKVINYVKLFFLLLVTQISVACPTCIGRLDKNTPPFFSADYYEDHYDAPIEDTVIIDENNTPEEV